MYIIKSQAIENGDGLDGLSGINPSGPSYVFFSVCCNFGTNWSLKLAWKTTK